MKTVIYYTQHAPSAEQIEWFLQRGYDQVLHPEALVKTPFANVGDAIERLTTYLKTHEHEFEIELSAIVAVLPINMLNPFIKAFSVPILSAVMEKVGQPAEYRWLGKFTRTYGASISSAPFDPVLGLGVSDTPPFTDDTKLQLEAAATQARRELWTTILSNMSHGLANILFNPAFGDDSDFRAAWERLTNNG